MQLGQIDISAITFDAKSRDDMLRLLRVLQHIWTNLELRNQVFGYLTPRPLQIKRMVIPAWCAGIGYDQRQLERRES